MPDSQDGDQKPETKQEVSTQTVQPTNAKDNPESNWNYIAGTAQNTGLPTDPKPISWTASEFIDHEKPASWFMAVAGIAILLAGLVYLITRDFINAGVVIVVAVLFAASGARRPRTLEYGLSNQAITIGARTYGFHEFKSFAIMEEGAINSIQLFQFKRFSTPITLYFPHDQEQAIVDFIGSYLPSETRSHDPIDRLMRKVRF